MFRGLGVVVCVVLFVAAVLAGFGGGGGQVRCRTGPVRPWLLGPLVRGGLGGDPVTAPGTDGRGGATGSPARVAWVVGSVTDLVAWVVVLLLVRMLTLSTLLVGTPSC